MVLSVNALLLRMRACYLDIPGITHIRNTSARLAYGADLEYNLRYP